MASNTTRAKPYTLSGDPNAYMVEQINEMFDSLFQDMELNETRALLSSGVADVTAAGPTRGDIISAQAGSDDVVRWTVLPIGSDQTYLRSNGTDPSWETIPEADIVDGALLARLADDETVTGAWTFEGATIVDDTLSVTGDFSVADPLFVIDVANDRVDIVNMAGGAFEVSGDGGAGAINGSSYNAVGATTTAALTLRRARGTLASPTAISSADVLGGIFFSGRLSASAWSANVAAIRAVAEQNFTGANNGTFLDFATTSLGAVSRTERMRITANGLINIATASALGLIDTNASHHLRLNCGSNLSADRILTLTTGDAARTLTINGDPTLDNWFNQDVRSTASPSFVSPIGTTSLIIGAASTAGVRLDLESGLLAIREGDDSAYVGFNSGAATINGRATVNGHIVADEQDTDPGTSDLDSLDSVGIYMKNNKFVIAYNNGGTITYITIPMDGSTTTWTHNTSAP